MMAEIGNPVGGPQVINLKPAYTSNANNSIARYEPPQPQGTVAVTETVQTKIEASKAEDEQKRDPLELAAEKLQAFIPDGQIMPNTRLRINQDDSGLFVYQNIDNESGEVVRQYPSEEILEFLSYYREAEGIVVDDLV
jgi:flagellar protein FlaG